MVRKLMIVAVLTVVALVVNAQKPVVYAGTFYKSDKISEAHALQVRSSIVSGLVDTQRFDVRDTDSDKQLAAESERRASEEAMSDENARTEVMTELAAKYLVYGFITECEAAKSDTEGGFAYKGNVAYTVKVVETATKKVVATKDFKLTGMLSGGGDTPDEAITDALKQVKNQMKNFVDENFKLKAVVLGEGFEVKKGNEMVSCLITMGSDHGVEKGQRLDVSVINIIAGRETNKVIGQITIQEVLAGDLSQCKVTKGGEEILKAMNDYLKIKDEDPDNAKELQVVTKKQSGFKNLLKQAEGMF